MKILLTGFDPFGNETINPAIEAVKLVQRDVYKLEVPTVFYDSIKVVEEKILEINPDVVISVGQAGGRKEITVERVANNINDARIKDNKGHIEESIFEDGPATYFSRLLIKQIVEDLKNEGIPASVSNSAGTFVCNHLMYGLLHNFPNLKCGFIHVPFIPEQTRKQHSMPLEAIARALEIVIDTMKKVETVS